MAADLNESDFNESCTVYENRFSPRNPVKIEKVRGYSNTNYMQRVIVFYAIYFCVKQSGQQSNAFYFFNNIDIFGIGYLSCKFYFSGKKVRGVICRGRFKEFFFR